MQKAAFDVRVEKNLMRAHAVVLEDGGKDVVKVPGHLHHPSSTADRGMARSQKERGQGCW